MPKVPDFPIAAPPDDGGHFGAFTRPQDMLIRPNANEPQKAPSLHYLAPDTPQPRTSKGSFLFALIIMAAVILALLAISSLFYGGG